ncbi:MAG: hypothetical protein ACREBN_07425 [Burkholderiaceae bacterium]
MNRAICALALAALTLSGCEHLRPRSLPDPALTRVTVVPGPYIVVDQEPIVVRRAAGQDTVTWRVAGGNVRFAEKGITVDAFVKPLPREVRAQAPASIAARKDGVPGFACSGSAEVFSCKIDAKVPPGVYSYTIRLSVDGRDVASDPIIFLE